MLLQQLVAYAERLEHQIMYQEQPVRWIIHLDAQGNFRRMDMTSDGSGKKSDRGKRFLTPHAMRASGIRAKLLADNAEYALGIGREDSDPAKVAERHVLFKQEVAACDEATGLAEVRAVRRYLEEVLPASPLPLPGGFDPGDIVTFDVEGILPFQLEPVQRYWADKFQASDSDADDPTFQAECLISGMVGPAMEREPVKIKGIPGGQTSGMNFISANAPAFESYGLSASQIAPVRLDLAEKYANALNTLLKDPATHLRLGPVVYVFWTKEHGLPPVVEDLQKPKESSRVARLRAGQIRLKTSVIPGQVRGQLKSVYAGNLYEGLEADAFYAVSLSASGSRVVVRDHLTTTVKTIGERLAAYFQAQRLVGAEQLGLYELAACLYRDANKEIVPSVPTAVLRFALHGIPLPVAFLAKLVSRNRAEQRVTRPRAALAKMVLISRGRIGMGELEELTQDRSEVGYQLGRLLAVLESIQFQSVKANNTVVDRFYGSLSTIPAVVFARLMSGAQDHLGKLRKNNLSAAVASDKCLQEVLGRIHGVPTTLPLEEQALFSLGYYHERARRFAEIEAAKAAKGEPL